MAVEEIGRLRTIAIVGQGGTGKTPARRSDALHRRRNPRSAVLTTASAAMDFEPEETKHHISISSAFHHLNWKKTEVILADTPGYSAFLPETLQHSARRRRRRDADQSGRRPQGRIRKNLGGDRTTSSCRGSRSSRASIASGPASTPR